MVSYYNSGLTDATADWAEGVSVVSFDSSIPTGMVVGSPMYCLTVSGDDGLPAFTRVTALNSPGTNKVTINTIPQNTKTDETVTYSNATQGTARISVTYLQKRDATPTS